MNRISVYLVSTLLLFVSLTGSAQSEKGIVILEDVCGSNNMIIETADGWYVAINWHGGVMLSKGDVVYGELKNYGIKKIHISAKDRATVWIHGYASNLERAKKEHCKYQM